MKLEGKVAVVTGGGMGIGRSIALTLAKEGADVAIYDVNLEAAKGVAEEVKALGREALAIKCDVSSNDDVTKATQQALDKFKEIDILVNNAGIAEPLLVLDTSEEVWDRIIDVNLKGQFLCAKAIAKQMIERKSGKIVNIASAQAHVSHPYLAVYAASKGGVAAFTRGLATEWAAYNINVNAVSPGMTETPINIELSRKNPEVLKGRIGRVPLRRQNQPEDIANAVLFLASSDSDNVTGQIIVVDGGSVALHSGYVWPAVWPPQ